MSPKPKETDQPKGHRIIRGRSRQCNQTRRSGMSSDVIAKNIFPFLIKTVAVRIMQ